MIISSSEIRSTAIRYILNIGLLENAQVAFLLKVEMLEDYVNDPILLHSVLTCSCW